MDTALSTVPITARRRMALALGLCAALLLAVGIAAATGDSGWTVVFSVIAFVLAVLLGLIGWGLLRSVALDRADAELDEAIESALQAHGGRASMCDCAVPHDPSELHITDADDACAHDGSGAACSHDCTTCVLAGLRTR